MELAIAIPITTPIIIAPRAMKLIRNFSKDVLFFQSISFLLYQTARRLPIKDGNNHLAMLIIEMVVVFASNGISPVKPFFPRPLLQYLVGYLSVLNFDWLLGGLRILISLYIQYYQFQLLSDLVSMC